MKNILALLVLLLFFAGKGKDHATTDAASGITILVSEGYGNTASNRLISCERYGPLPGPGDLKFDISDKKKIDEILRSIKQAKPVTPGFHDLGTQGKLYIRYTSGTVDSLCFGNSALFTHGYDIMEFKDHTLKDIVTGLVSEAKAHK